MEQWKELIQSHRKKRINSSRRNVMVVVVAFVVVHAVFFLSGFLPDKEKYVASAFRQPQELSSYKTVSLIRWDYSKKDRTMEVVFDITDKEYSEGSMNFSATCDGQSIQSQIVYNKDGMLVLQLYKVPRADTKRIIITFEYTPQNADKAYSAGFYSDVGCTNPVDALPVLSNAEYFIGRQDYDIAYYQSLIEQIDEDTAANNASMEKLQQDVERLQGSTGELTTDEILNLNEMIVNDQTQMKALQAKNTSMAEQRAGYEENIKVLEKRRDAYEE